MLVLEILSVMENEIENTPQSSLPPIRQQQDVSSNISWLKTLAYGFTLVSIGIAIGIIGYVLTTSNFTD